MARRLIPFSHIADIGYLTSRKAEKAGKSGGKRQKHMTVKLGPFSKSIVTKILREMLFLLGQADESIGN